MVVDLMHLVVVTAGVLLGAASLIAFRTRLPRGRFIIFGASSIAALFGCAAVGGDVGLMSQSAWFYVVIAIFAAIGVSGIVVERLTPRWR